MWVFAILIVLVLGGVAAVAAGFGSPMPDASTDRPDILVPADTPLRSADLRKVRFSMAFRGYRMSEVDALLARLATEAEEREAHDAHDAPDTHGTRADAAPAAGVLLDKEAAPETESAPRAEPEH